MAACTASWANMRTAAPAKCTNPQMWRRAGCRHRVGARRTVLAPAGAQAFKDMLGALEPLSDEELAAWAVQHRERLTLRFLSWLSDEELAASSDDPDQQQRLWELGSKLMALREGLSPVGNEVLQAELRAAALRCGASADDSDDSAPSERQGAQQQQQQQQQLSPPAVASPVFASAVQQTAALGLSPEGLTMFQQQAAALEAVVGLSRARSLTEVIGRARVDEEGQLQRLADSDAAVRILDVLLTVPDRGERAAMLPDAFTPPAGGSAEAGGEGGYSSAEEDQVYTTPLRLLQAIDLYLSRLERSQSAPEGHQQAAALAGDTLGLSLPELKATLSSLREDVEAYWQAGEGDSC